MPEQRSFNLIDQPWVPIAGMPRRKSLHDLFSDPALPRLGGDPVDKIVVFRLLLSICSASNQIPDDAAWHALTPEIIAANALRYLEKWHGRFDIYDAEHPFLQFPQLANGSAEPCSTLQANVASGNKTVLTGWHRECDLNDAEKTVLLLRSVCFGYGGKKYDNSLVLSSGYEKGKTGKCGALLGAYGYLHSYYWGDTIIESLRLNLLTECDIQATKAFANEMGTPFWENMPTGEDDQRAKEYKSTYLGRLFPLDKFLLLKDGGIVKTDGMPYPSHKNGAVDPALALFEKKGERGVIWAKTDKRPWRDLPAILSFLEAGDKKYPLFLACGCGKMRRFKLQKITVWLGGISVSSNSGEQYLSGKDDNVEAEFSFSTELMVKDGYQKFKAMMEDLDETSKILTNAVKQYYKQLSCDNDAASASTLFYEKMKPRAQGIIDLAFSADNNEELRRKEKSAWWKIAQAVYDACCPHETARQLMAWVECRPRLKKSKNEGNL
jgi:CRISPR system Cascade subunit CasA